MAMLSFFRKDKAKAKAKTSATPATPDDVKPTQPAEGKRVAAPQAPVPAPAPAAKVHEPAPPTQAESGYGNGIQVVEADMQMAPEIEEAVMLYANSRTGDAATTLNRFILNNRDSRDPLPWYLLFDIYEATGQHQPFEDLAMDFAVRFERSPPTWRTVRKTEAGKPVVNRPSFAFEASLSQQDKARLELFLEACKTANSAGFDFTKTPVPSDDSYARIMLDSLSRLVATGKEINLSGGSAFVVRLNASRLSGLLTESTWLLLLMLLQLQGKAQEFDEVAVQYAVHFEISPPSYSPPKHIANEPAPPEVEPSSSGQIFSMHGQLGPGSSGIFDSLREFSAPLSQVEIDLSEVTRIDFAVVGLMVDTVMSLAQAGKKVIFFGGNGLVNLFLQMVGVGQFATIQQKPRK
jgi:ABC-type transporter Mla MlaB component